MKKRIFTVGGGFYMKKRIFAILVVLMLSLQPFAFADESEPYVVHDLGDYRIVCDRIPHAAPGTGNTWINRNYGVIDRDGNVILEQVYGDISVPVENRAAFVKNGLIGFFDENWEVVIEPQYVSDRLPISSYIKFSQGLCAVGKKSDTEYGYPYKYGYIDLNGKAVTEFIYSDAQAFENGTATVSIDEDIYYYNTLPKTGRIDKEGNIVEPLKFSYARGEDEAWKNDTLDLLMSVNLVDINGRRYKNSDIEYPFINYLGISYIPLTYYGCRMMGINCDWTAEDGVILSGGGKVSEDIVGKNNLQGGRYYKGKIYKGKITINGTVYEYGDTAYPLISFRDVVYLPVTWKTGMEALGIEYTFLRADQIENSSDGCMVFKTK